MWPVWVQEEGNSMSIPLLVRHNRIQRPRRPPGFGRSAYPYQSDVEGRKTYGWTPGGLTAHGQIGQGTYRSGLGLVHVDST